MDESLVGAPTLWALVEARAERSGDRPMLLDDHDRRVTFAEARHRAERVAAALAARGVGRGTRVSWQLPTRIETVLFSLALSRLGAVQNPIIPIYRSKELAHILTESRAELLVVPPDRGAGGGDVASALGQLARPPEVLALDGLPEGDPATLGPAPRPGPDDEPAWLYYTSGTTSAPKGVRHTDATLLAGALALATAIDVQPTDVGSIAFPYAHIGGPDYLGLLLLGGIPAVLLPAFRPAQAVEVYRRHGVTIAGGTTAFYVALLDEQRKQPDEPILPSLRLLAGGGAPKPPEVFHEVRRELGVPVIHGWAMTECPMTTCGTPADRDEDLAETEGPPVRGAEVKVVDDRGRTLGPDQPGELCVRGTMLFKGYADPALDAAAFDDEGWFRTGDVGKLRPDGRLVITGRSKDVIIRKGENISAKEVEDLLYQHPAIGAVAVIGLPDRARGELVCAVVEPAPGREAPSLAEVVEHCRAAGLATQKTPERVEPVDALPRNATGKVLKEELRRRYGS